MGGPCGGRGKPAGEFRPHDAFGYTHARGRHVALHGHRAYGLTTGLLASKRVPAFAALLIAQVAGRGVRALAIVMGAYLFSSPVGIPVIWNSVLTGLPGIVLQWALVPLIVFYVEKKTHAE